LTEEIQGEINRNFD